MKQISLIFILSFFLQNIFGQVLTKEEAYAFADKLWEMEILSERGRNMLKMYIDEEKFRPINYATDFEIERHSYKKLTKSLLLNFCVEVYFSEFQYRMGYFEYIKILADLRDDGKERKLLNESDYEKANEIFQNKLEEFEGYKIEQRITAIDSLIESELGWTSYPNLNSMIFGIQERKLVHKNRSILGKTRTKTARNLFEIGFINQKVYDEVLTKITSTEIRTELEVFKFATERVSFFEDLPLLKIEERKLLNKLRETQILSKSSYQNLINSNDSMSVLSRFEIFKACENLILYKVNETITSKMSRYQEILKNVKPLFPDLKIEEFSFEMTEKVDPIFKELSQIGSRISCKLGGKEYKVHSTEQFLNKMQNPTWTKDSVSIYYGRNIVQLLNKWLADQNSLKRLYLCRNYEKFEILQIGMILMTENQFKAWGDPYGLYMDLTAQSHDNTFNRKGITQIISDYELIGLFDHLTKEEVKEGKEKTFENAISSYQDILYCFPNVIIDFDWEYHNLTNPYEELTTKFAKSSKGNFKPENIKDDFSKNYEKAETTFSFEVLGKKYQREFRMMGDWLDHRFISLINDAIKDSQVDGKFYDCIDDAQYDGYIFLTKRQYDFLKKEQPKFFYKNNSHD